MNKLKEAAQRMVDAFAPHADMCRPCTIEWQNLKEALKQQQVNLNNEVLLQHPREDVEWQKQQMEYAQQLKVKPITLEEIILDFKNKIDDSDNKHPTKLFGPNLEQVLNAAGFYKKKEWVGLTEEELIVIKGKTCPEIDWSARHGVPLNNGEQNAWLFTWFMAFAKETEAKLKEKNT